jgi:hypothetical protein
MVLRALLDDEECSVRPLFLRRPWYYAVKRWHAWMVVVLVLALIAGLG